MKKPALRAAFLAFTLLLTMPLFQNCSGGGGGGGGAGGGDGGSSQLGDVIQIAAGDDAACALISDGTIRCWGSNDDGQLGGPTSPTPFKATTVRGITTATGIAVGGFFGCASLANGSVRCWGLGTLGRLGDGTQNDSSTPVQVFGITNATSKISAGKYNACVILSTGSIKCWGTNSQNGNGVAGVNSCNVPNDCDLSPVTVFGITTATEISVGYPSACAILADTTVRCWGGNNSGGIGNGTINTAPTPVVATGVSGATKISVGNFFHACALVTNGEVQCWGDNRQGQLGTGSEIGPQTCTTACSKTAITANDYTGAAFTGVTSLSAGYNFTCVVQSDGKIQCFGLNGDGELGSGGIGPFTCGFYDCSPLPLEVIVSGAATAVAGGNSFACALLADKTVSCWGRLDNPTKLDPTPIEKIADSVGDELPTAQNFRLSLTKSGNERGTGTVTSSLGGINCNAACIAQTVNLPSTSTVVLTATATGGHIFSGWAGCNGVSAGNTLTLSMSEIQDCMAVFSDNQVHFLMTPYTSYVAKIGTGAGTITGGGINCGATCSAVQTTGSATLTEAPTAGSTFVKWLGDCSGTATTSDMPYRGNCVALFDGP
ncbi:MAG: hypothetical protein ABL958_15540 [Bdellovibrionia bacterium]